MPSVLGSAVFQMTATTAGLTVGLNRASGMITHSLASISSLALNSSNRIAQGFGLIGVAATVASRGIGLLAVGLGSLTGTVIAASNAIDAMHNLELTFGSSADALTDVINNQSAAFGHSRVALMGYADTVGQELKAVGVDAKAAAEMAKSVILATSQLAANRRISPEAAFAQIKSGAMLYDRAQVRAIALEIGLINNRNQELTRGNEMLAEYFLAVRGVAASTEMLTGATQTWSGQVQVLGNDFRELATTIGSSLEPMFISILSHMDSWIRKLNEAYSWFTKFSATHSVWGALMFGPQGDPNAPRDAQAQKAIDVNNASLTKQNREENILGQVMGRGGGGGGHGAYRGSLAGFHEKIQESAWQQNQLATLKKQAEIGQQQLTQLQSINGKLGKDTGTAERGW